MQENSNQSLRSLVDEYTVKNILHKAGWTLHHCSFLTDLEEVPQSLLPTFSKEIEIKECSEVEFEERCEEGRRAVMGGPAA